MPRCAALRLQREEAPVVIILSCVRPSTQLETVLKRKALPPELWKL